MFQTVSAIELRQNLGEILNRVALRHDEFIVKRGSRPMAVIVPVDQLEALKSAARTRLTEIYEKSWARKPIGSFAMIDKAKHSSRKNPPKES